MLVGFSWQTIHMVWGLCGPLEFFPLFLKTALQLLSGLILFSCLCHLESKGRSFLSLPVLAEADLIPSAVAMFGNFSFRVLFCD